MSLWGTSPQRGGRGRTPQLPPIPTAIKFRREPWRNDTLYLSERNTDLHKSARQYFINQREVVKDWAPRSLEKRRLFLRKKELYQNCRDPSFSNADLERGWNDRAGIEGASYSHQVHVYRRYHDGGLNGPSTHVGISSSASAGESPFNTAHNPYSPNGAFTVAESVTLPRKPFLLSHSRPPVPGERTSRWAAANGLVNDPLQQQQHQQGMLSYQQASNTGPMMIEHYPPTHQREQQQLQHQQHSYYGQSHNTLPSIQRQGQDRNAYAIGGAGGEYHEDARYAASAPPPLHQQLIQHFSPQQEQHSQQHQQQYPQRNAQSSHNQHHAPSRQSTTTSSSASTFSSPDNSGGFAGAGNTVSMANVGGYGYSNYGYGYGSTTSGTISGAGSAYAEASMSGSTAGRGRGETG